MVSKGDVLYPVGSDSFMVKLMDIPYCINFYLPTRRCMSSRLKGGEIQLDVVSLDYMSKKHVRTTEFLYKVFFDLLRLEKFDTGLDFKDFYPNYDSRNYSFNIYPLLEDHIHKLDLIFERKWLANEFRDHHKLHERDYKRIFYEINESTCPINRYQSNSYSVIDELFETKMLDQCMTVDEVEEKFGWRYGLTPTEIKVQEIVRKNLKEAKQPLATRYVYGRTPNDKLGKSGVGKERKNIPPNGRN